MRAAARTIGNGWCEGRSTLGDSVANRRPRTPWGRGLARGPAPLRRARRSVSASFLVHAAVFGTWAPRIPAIKHHLHLDHGQIGIALTGAAVGFLAGTRLAGSLAQRF